jgi:hypothetical protein
MTFGLILILSILGVTSPKTETWQCRNDVQIVCTGGKCEAETKDAFTPMSVSFDDTGMMSVCAYTGCWEGTGEVSKKNNFMMLSGENLKFSTSDSKDMYEHIAITLDRRDNVAMLKAGEFAHPLLCEKKVQKSDTPTFDQYKVKISTAKPKPIKFSGNKDARMFRTRLKEAYKEGVNFAGHFVFATWGCGTSCQQGAIIDTKTGVVYFPKELNVMTFRYIDEDVEPLQFQKDSKLFILNGYPGTGEDNLEGAYYFVWEGTKFKQVKFVVDDRSDQ